MGTRLASNGFALALMALTSFLTTSSHAEKLSIERMFTAPDLSGASLRAPQISPDGRLVAYLRSSERNKDRLDLWAYDIATRQHRLLVEAARLVPNEGALSTEEVQRRERQRTSSLSGIVDYQFASNSRYLLVPIAGDLYVYDLKAKAGKAVRRIAHTGRETDPRFSPLGNFVSFVRDQNLVVYQLATGKEQPITRDGGGAISFGTAEFVAQEEMARTTGYWWAPDEKRIAFTRVDESPVPEVERFEIYADRTQVVRQRYPAAGGHNAIVQLFVSEIGSGAAPVPVDLGSSDFYLARVSWFPDNSALAVQREARDQKTLTLLRADPLTGATSELFTERSEFWVDLNDNLTFLPRAHRFIWASSRTGFQHLYLYDWSGSLIRPLTQGEWQVTGDNDSHGMRGVDEAHGLVYFVANAESPLERHLYSVSLTDAHAPMKRITVESGWHAITMSPDTRSFLDTFSTPDQPPSLTLRSANPATSTSAGAHRATSPAATSAAGDVLAELVPNKLTSDHPYAPYLPDHLPTEFGTLSAKDGQTLYYQITKPRDLEPGRRYPVIVDVYGGPGIQRVRKAWPGYPRGTEGFFRQVLAQNGYIVFSLDNRGSGSRGVRFETALYHRMGSVEVEDQVTGVRFLRSLPFVDPARIGVLGWSYGGYMALMCMMQAPDVFAAGVSGAPVTDWSLYDTHYTERFMSTPQSNPDGYARSSVLHHAAKLDGPLLIMHGMADDNVLFTNSTALFKRLQDLDKPFEMMTYPGGKHGLLRHADTGRHGYMTIKAFLDRTLGSEASVPD
jgi:dipeptidyl-peptidase 4